MQLKTHKRTRQATAMDKILEFHLEEMMNDEISIQMITPVSTQHYNSHLGNNDGKRDDYKTEIGCITPY